MKSSLIARISWSVGRSGQLAAKPHRVLMRNVQRLSLRGVGVSDPEKGAHLNVSEEGQQRTRVCVSCGKDNKKLMAKGKCNICYLRDYRNDPVNQERIKQSKLDWWKRNEDYCLAKSKRNREIAHFDGNRELALQRDNYQCSRCGTSEQLTVHHKDGSGRGSDTHNNDLENLVTLCRKCHVEEHREDLKKAKVAKYAGRWSLKYDCCIDCGRTDRKHAAFGRCSNCKARFKRQQKRCMT